MSPKEQRHHHLRGLPGVLVVASDWDGNHHVTVTGEEFLAGIPSDINGHPVSVSVMKLPVSEEPSS